MLKPFFPVLFFGIFCSEAWNVHVRYNILSSNDLEALTHSLRLDPHLKVSSRCPQMPLPSTFKEVVICELNFITACNGYADGNNVSNVSKPMSFFPFYSLGHMT